MEAKETQLLNDALELIRLTLQESKANGLQLGQTDIAVDTVGQGIVQLNKTASDILEQEKEHHNILVEMKENQEVVHETNAALLDTADSITQVFKNNSETLAHIEATIEHGNTQDKQAQETFFNELSNKNESYGENLSQLLHQLTDTKQTIQSLDTHDELKQLLSNVEDVQVAINTLEEGRMEQQALLSEQFVKAEEDIQASIATLNALQEQAGQLVDTFETAVARIGNIELKLDVLSDDENTEDVDYTMVSEQNYADTEGTQSNTDENGGE